VTILSAICHLIRCPHCGYEMPPEAKLGGWLRRLRRCGRAENALSKGEISIRDPSTATLTSVALQTGGRMARTWGYLPIGLGIGALGWGMSRQANWPRGLGLLGLFGAAIGVVMFILEYVFVTQTKDTGGGMVQAFTAMFFATGRCALRPRFQTRLPPTRASAGLPAPWPVGHYSPPAPPSWTRSSTKSGRESCGRRCAEAVV